MPIDIALPLLAVIFGLALVLWSANRFIDGAISTARRYRISPTMIGLTLVAFGTSAPELVVSVTAAVTEADQIAIGNAIGSNIANIGLVLGITALIAPIPVHRSVLRLDLPLLLLITVLVSFLLINRQLGTLDGIALLLLMAGSFWLLARRRDTLDKLSAGAEEAPLLSPITTLGYVLGGLLILIISSRLLVWGAVELAVMAGVSELIIGLTLIALGTSLPELAATVASALKGRHDMALGSIVGSNLFNLLPVLAAPALIGGATLDAEVLHRDYLSMALFTLLLVLFAWLGRVQDTITRWEGGILTAAYLGYSVIILNAITSAS